MRISTALRVLARVTLNTTLVTVLTEALLKRLDANHIGIDLTLMIFQTAPIYQC